MVDERSRQWGRMVQYCTVLGFGPLRWIACLHQGGVQPNACPTIGYCLPRFKRGCPGFCTRPPPLSGRPNGVLSSDDLQGQHRTCFSVQGHCWPSVFRPYFPIARAIIHRSAEERADGGFLHSVHLTSTREASESPVPGLAAHDGFQQYCYHIAPVAKYGCSPICHGISSPTCASGTPLEPPKEVSAAVAGGRGLADICPPSSPQPSALPVPAGDAASFAAPVGAPNVQSEAILSAYSMESVKDLCKAS